MIYDPKNELTDVELSKLDEKDFFEYLDSKANHLKQFTRPLEGYHTKRFAGAGAAIEGRELTNEELEALRLKNIKDLDQIECAKLMNTSQSTFQRILSSAYKKITEALIEGKAIKIIK